MNQPQLDPKQASPRACLCGSEFFDVAYRIGIVSRLAPGNQTSRDVLIKYEALICRGCGVEFREHLPRDVAEGE